MLGRSSRESGTIVRLAARLGGWEPPSDAEGERLGEVEDLLDLGTVSRALMTVGSLDDLSAVLHLGHPAQPDHPLEQRLLQAAGSVVLTAAVAVPSSWSWVGRGDDVRGTVVVDDAGARDCRGALRDLGLAPHLVPTSMPVDERVALAGPDGSLVIERSRVPDGYVELAASAALPTDPVWYGLAERRPAGAHVTEPSQVWLALGPTDDHRGSLAQSLQVLADTGFDLQHLRSQRSDSGLHVFYTSFACQDPAAFAQLQQDLAALSVRQRVLAVLPGTSFVPGPEVVEPQWTTS